MITESYRLREGGSLEKLNKRVICQLLWLQPDAAAHGTPCQINLSKLIVYWLAITSDESLVLKVEPHSLLS